MYTIISATNRKGSNTLRVSKEYQHYFSEEGVQVRIYSLEDFHSMFKDAAFERLEEELLIPTQKFVFIMPEYNGSFLGIFKLMMDISDITRCWFHKKVMLVGVANGRAGNLRGLDNMTNMCHYMKMNVLPNKLPISSVSNELKDERFYQETTLNAIRNQIRQFIEF